MKKSNRYRTRYAAKKRAMQREVVGLRKANALLLKGMESQSNLMDGLKQELRRGPEPGVTTIRLGKALPGFRGELLGLSVTIDVQQFFYQLRMERGNDFQNLSYHIKRHCHDVMCKMEAAMLEYVQKERMF